ncbi:MAG TPA: hypothetical protein VFI04_02415 [Gaiellaceae bacterium]|nr:hypothetical protein [Gaiellaceae bacterium]
MKRLALLGLACAVVVAGCGGSSNSGFPTIQAARTYGLAEFTPGQPVAAGKPVRVSFQIRRPDGKPLTSYRHGPGPHTGVHLIIVRRDLDTIIHRHPPIAADGTIAESITFPEPGPYRVVVDAYPSTGQQRNFQLFGSLRVKGAYAPQPLPAYRSTVTVDGYRVTLHGRPTLHAIQANFLTITVTDPSGKPARFTPWYGALAHAIFFRSGSLDYFHTHVCARGAAGCTSVLGAARVTGSSSTPGKLSVGVLVPAAGRWRLFLQCRVNGHVLTAPFTLTVKP